MLVNLINVPKDWYVYDKRTTRYVSYDMRNDAVLQICAEMTPKPEIKPKVIILWISGSHF